MKTTIPSVMNPDWKYTTSKETDIRKTFAKHGFKKAKAKRKQIQYFTEQELAESREPMPKAPRGWTNTELTEQELEEARLEMERDYEEMGDPYHPYHLRRVG